MTDNLKLSVQIRRRTGKNATNALRRQGLIPAVVYGAGKAARPLAVAEGDFKTLFRHLEGESVLIELAVETDGRIQPLKALLREVQRDPVQRHILHVDFQEVTLEQRIQVNVPIVLVGSPIGVRDHDGTLEQALHELEIECQAGQIPEHIEVDVTALGIGDSLHISDLTLGDMTILTDPSVVVANVQTPRVEEEVVVEEEIEEPELVEREGAGTDQDEEE